MKSPAAHLICVICVICGFILLAGCKCDQWRPGPYVVDAIAPVGQLPTYPELAQRYNANLAALDRLWARADVTVEYRDDKGRKRSDRGDDSKLLVAPPNDVALSVGGIGPPVLWVGSNAERYWVFHLRDDKPVYYGLQSNIGRPGTRPLPSPIYPHELVRMLGVVPLDPTASPTPTVEWLRGYYLVELPWERLRLLIDPATALPVRIDMLDPYGYSTMAVRLYDPVTVARTGKAARDTTATAAGAAPQIASRIQAWLLDRDVKVTLKLSDVQDGRGKREIDGAFTRVFDFDRLVNALQPGEMIDLDAAAPPADHTVDELRD